jgi:hypothetical protein
VDGDTGKPFLRQLSWSPELFFPHNNL